MPASTKRRLQTPGRLRRLPGEALRPKVPFEVPGDAGHLQKPRELAEAQKGPPEGEVQDRGRPALLQAAHQAAWNQQRLVELLLLECEQLPAIVGFTTRGFYQGWFIFDKLLLIKLNFDYSFNSLGHLNLL